MQVRQSSTLWSAILAVVQWRQMSFLRWKGSTVLSLSRWRIPTMVKQKWRESEEIWLSNKALRLKWLLLSVECGVVWGDGFYFGRHRFSNYCVCLWSMWQKPKLLAHANLCIQQNSLLTTWIWHARKCIITTGCVMLCYWSCFRQSHIFKVCLSLSLSALPSCSCHGWRKSVWGKLFWKFAPLPRTGQVLCRMARSWTQRKEADLLVCFTSYLMSGLARKRLKYLYNQTVKEKNEIKQLQIKIPIIWPIKAAVGDLFDEESHESKILGREGGRERKFNKMS